MRLHHTGGRAKLGLVTVLALVVGLVGATGASAAPGDNLRNAAKCLRGWQSLKMSNQRSFTGPLGCVIYVLRGGSFYVAPSTTDPVPNPGGGRHRLRLDSPLSSEGRKARLASPAFRPFQQAFVPCRTLAPPNR